MGRNFVHDVTAIAAAFSVVESAVSPQCFDYGKKNYSLAWSAQGTTFFDDWNFGEQDFTNGAVRYVGRDEAVKDTLTQAFATHAIVRPGAIERAATGDHRKSIRLNSKKDFTYFLVAMKYSHSPFGCGVWPAFWTSGADGNWPSSGELDIFEYWNNAKSEVSFHTSVSKVDGCKLDKAQLNKKGCPQFDDKNKDLRPYDCQTNYTAFPPRLGCAPSPDHMVRKTGEEYSNNPGVMAAEWTKEYIKVFYIPEAEIPEDLESGAPKPDTWDKYVISYYPFAASEKAHPGSCNLTGKGVSSAQTFVLNIELCGGRGSLEFPFMCNGISTCRNKNYAGPGDCCTEYMTNDKKSSEAIDNHAFFNISYIKVWQQTEDQAKSGDAVSEIVV